MTVGRYCFNVIEDDTVKELSQLVGDSYVEYFNLQKNSCSVFELSSKFKVKLNTHSEPFLVTLNESNLYKFIYTNEGLFNDIGKAGCIILDFSFSIGGSEAISETYFGVMNTQKQSSQDNDTLDMRTLINFTMGDVSSCPEAIANIAKTYTDGDLAHKAAKHRANIFVDKRQRTLNKYVVSKAVDNIRNKKCAAFIK